MDALVFLLDTLGKIHVELASINTPLGIPLFNIMFGFLVTSILIGFISVFFRSQLHSSIKKGLYGGYSGDQIRRMKK